MNFAFECATPEQAAEIFSKHTSNNSGIPGETQLNASEFLIDRSISCDHQLELFLLSRGATLRGVSPSERYAYLILPKRWEEML